MGKSISDIKRVAIFKGKEIRKTFVDDEWWFSVIDVIAVLTESVKPKDYWYRMKKRVKAEDEFQLSTICRQLKLLAKDGKKYLTDCSNTKGLFRIIQSIPSSKAEPFKLWLAKVGYERVQEIEDPELAIKRTRKLYNDKGYSEDWIEKRIRGIAIRDELTDEWKKRGLREQKEYSILTAEILKATFGITPSEYKKLKNLKQENLRDHMTDLELIFSMLGERATTEITQTNNSQGYYELEKDAQDGGSIAGNARKALEEKTGNNVVNKGNYLKQNSYGIEDLTKKK